MGADTATEQKSGYGMILSGQVRHCLLLACKSAFRIFNQIFMPQGWIAEWELST